MPFSRAPTSEPAFVFTTVSAREALYPLSAANEDVPNSAPSIAAIVTKDRRSAALKELKKNRFFIS
jgi:hypothetical protein